MTVEDANKARAIVSQWFWQPAEGHNYRYRGALRTMTRFYESAPMEPDVVKLVIDYLRDEVIDGGISLLNKSLDLGSGWKAMDAFYRTDETEKWAGTESRKIRIYQILARAPDDADAVDGPYELEKGCQYKVTHTFHWNVAALPSVPESSSGVGYALEGVVRDRETGLYSCVLVKRERMRQDIAEYTAEKTVYRDTSEEAHFGVKAASVAGKPASVAMGVAVTRKVTKNEDCTTDVHNVTTVDKPVAHAVVTKEETVFETRTTTENRNQPSAASMSLEPGSSVRDETTPTNLHNQTMTETVEKPVSDAVVEFSRTLHGTQKSVTHRNQPTPVTDDDMVVGERRSSRMTEGGNHDNTIVTQVVELAGMVAKSDAKTIFEDAMSTRENVAAHGELPECTADSAGDGKTHNVDVRLNEDGTADVTKSEKQEKPVSDAVVEVRKTLRGVVRSVTHRNQSEPLELDPVDMAVGETRTTRKTDGGLNDNTRSVLVAVAPGMIAKSCEKSAAAHTDAETKAISAESAEAELGCVDDPETNVVVEKTVRKNEDGRTADVTTRRRRLKVQRSKNASVSGTGEVVTSTTKAENEETMAELDDGGVNKRVEVSNSPNGAGGFNTVRTVTTFRPQDTGDIVLRLDDANEQVIRRFRNQADYGGLLPTDDVPGRISASLSKNDHSSWDGGYSITRPRQVAGYGVRVIEEAKDETFSLSQRYGHWVYSNALSRGTYTWVWEYRRACTMKVRYTGLTSEMADQLKEALDAIFTRIVYGSTFNSLDGGFLDGVVGKMRMAKVTKYHIAGSLWGVFLNVNEDTSRLRPPGGKISPEYLFAYERGWRYDIPSGGENVG